MWYAENNIWLNFATNVLKKTYKYFYIIELNYTTFDNPNKHMVLKLSTSEDFDKFTFKYGYITKEIEFDFIFIYWPKVIKKYGGIEVTSDIKNRRYINTPTVIEYYKKHNFNIKNDTSSWFYAFDIPSGCVWNPKSIKTFTQI